MTSSMPRQGSRVNYCPVVWYLRAVFTARLSDAEKAQTKPSDDTMIVNEPVKPGSCKHPDDMDVINSELIY